MKDLEYLAKQAKYALIVPSPKQAISAKPETILAIAEAFRALEQAKVSAEHERDCHMDIADHFKESWVTQKQRAEAAEAKLQAVTESRDQWEANAHEFSRCADRLEAKLAELEKQKPTGLLAINTGDGWKIADEAAYIFASEHGFAASELFTRPTPAADLAELVPCCLVDAMSNLGLEGVSIGDKSIIGKAIEVLHNIQERTK